MEKTIEQEQNQANQGNILFIKFTYSHTYIDDKKNWAELTESEDEEEQYHKLESRSKVKKTTNTTATTSVKVGGSALNQVKQQQAVKKPNPTKQDSEISVFQIIISL